MSRASSPWRRLRASLVLAVAIGAVSTFVACDRGAQRVTARGDGLSGEGVYEPIDLGTVSRVALRNHEVVVEGGMVSLNPRPTDLRVLRYPLPASLEPRTDVSGEWVAGAGYGELVHVRSGRRVTIDGLPDRGMPLELAAAAISDREHLVVFAAGDWKAGPKPAYWGYVVIRGDPLGDGRRPPR